MVLDHCANLKILKQHRMNSSNKKIGIIAGSGELPKQLIKACQEDKREYFIVALDNTTEEETVKNTPHSWIHIGKVSGIIKELKKQNVTDVLLAGRVGRPSPSSLNLDFGGLKLLIKLSKLDSKGDDKIFSTIIKYIEGFGFDVIGAEEILENLLIKKEVLGEETPDEVSLNDISIGTKAALAIGDLDIGQAVIVQQGQILGVEGPEGTDRLVKRCREFHAEGKGGVLIKVKKPTQDDRVDLPSIGVTTVQNAYDNNLIGIAVEAGGSLVIDREAVIKKANELGIFILGIEPTDYK